jgi:hypothetical protein
MAKVKTEQLKAGMVVAVEVKNMDNMLLLPVGCSLAEKHIEIFQAWGITEVDVASAEGVAEPEDPLARLSPEEARQLTEATRKLFWQLDDTEPIQMEVLNLVLRRRAKKVAHG